MRKATHEVWRAARDALDVCPWPGPRPLGANNGSLPPGAEDNSLLCGRKQELRDFVGAVRMQKLVILHGESGVGKSSLLNSGLIPSLAESGFIVAACNDWSGSSTQSSAADFVADRIKSTLRRQSPTTGLGDIPLEGFFAELDARAGSRTVLVLDQFEELLREDDQDFVDALFDVVVQLNRYLTMKVVISLRSEYLYALRSLEQRVNPYVTSHFPLDEVHPDAALEIVKSGNHGVDESAIKSDVALLIADAWKSAQELRKGSVGLLHLQALLYALHGIQAKPVEGAPSSPVVTRDTLTRLLEDQKLLLETPQDAILLFRRALSLSTSIKIDRCREAAELPEVNVDRALISGAQATLALMIRHLSSAGYKIMRETEELADLAIGGELEQLRRGAAQSREREADPADGPIADGQYQVMFDVVVGSLERGGSDWDLLASSIMDAAEVADARWPSDDGSAGPDPIRVRRWSDRMHHRASPLAADDAEVTSGLMLGMAPAGVLVEELRRFAFALDWLRSSSVVRVSAPGRSRMVVSLIHDRFCDALLDVARLESSRTIRQMNALSAQHSIDLWLKDIPSFDPVGPEPGMDEHYRFIVNQRWRGGWVVANFRNVVFVNCDLRGTGFDNCHFEGVTFVNCLLDGAMFSNCTIAGPRSEPPQGFEATQTGFVVEAPMTAELLNLYRRETEGTADLLYSGVPGLPAIPASRAEVEGVRRVELPKGSLTFYGGRISTLAVRNLRCKDEAWLSLRHTTGSGLDIVEQQNDARIEVSGSALRHVGITSDPYDDDPGGPVEIDVNGSAMYQVWIGDDMKGSLDATNSKLIHVFNASTDFTATLRSDVSRYHGLVGVMLGHEDSGVPDPYVPLEPLKAIGEVDRDRSIRDECKDMDYRRRPHLDAAEYSGAEGEVET